MPDTRQATPSDIPGILALQEKYLYRNLSEADRTNGFVTTPFTSAQIEAAMDLKGVFVATEGNSIVGYAYAAAWPYFLQWKMFEFMVAALPKLTYQNQTLSMENTFQYGPICIDEPYRGGKLFRQLFETMRLDLSIRYPISLTFINKANQRSFHGHVHKLGWEVLTEFRFNSNEYYYLAFDMTKSVID